MTIEVIGLFFAWTSLFGTGLVYIITKLHSIDKKVRSDTEIEGMIELKLFRHLEKCRNDRKDKTGTWIEEKEAK